MLESSEKPAIVLSKDYRILAVNEAYRKHYKASPELGHDRCFAVSHGYDSPCDDNGEQCPLRNCLSSKRNERVVHIHHGPTGAEYVAGPCANCKRQLMQLQEHYETGIQVGGVVGVFLARGFHALFGLWGGRIFLTLFLVVESILVVHVCLINFYFCSFSS